MDCERQLCNSTSIEFQSKNCTARAAFNSINSGNEQSGLSPIEPSSSPEPSPSPEPSSSSQPSLTIYIDIISNCMRVIDGDTIEICSGIRVRLADIDAPESIESGYETSTNALKSRVLDKQVFLDMDGRDSGGRYVCVLYVKSGSKYKNVNFALVVGDYAVYDDHDNNVFDPTKWSMYENNLATSNAEIILDSEDDSPSPEEEIPSWAVYIGSSQKTKYHKLDCYWASQINPENKVFFSSKADAESKGYIACGVCKP